MTLLNDKNYEEYIKEGEKVVICTAGYCKICNHAMNEIQSLPAGKIILTEPGTYNTMRRLKVRRVPTVIFYKDGKEVNRAEGTTALFNLQDQA